MIKLLFKLPNNVLLKYLDDHIEKLTERDFFQLVAHNIVIPRHLYQRNQTFINSSSVLRWVIFNDPEAVFEFNSNLFTDDILDDLSISKITLTVDLIEHYPIFFTNQNMVERIIKEFPILIKRLKPEQITDNIIRHLIINKYILDEEDVRKFPFLLDNSLLANNALYNNPYLVFQLPNLSSSNIQFIKEHQLIPTYDDYLKYPLLRNDDLLIKESFKKDVSCIVFMNDEILDFYLATDAKNRGFIATEQDLIFNHSLCKYRPIMEPAIMNNPYLIVYTEFTCVLSEQCVDYALNNIEITTDILEAHPDLCRNFDIISKLPQFEAYSAYKTWQEKIDAIVCCLAENKIDDLKKLPFLRKKFGSKTEVDDQIALVKLLYEEVQTNKIEDQRRHFSFLEQLVDGVCNIRYYEQKDKFEFGDIASLHNYIVFQFIKAEDKNSLNLVVEQLSDFTGNELSKDELKQQIFMLYNLFLSRHTSLLLSDTHVLCNMILNAHRNNFFKNERKKIMLELTQKLDLSLKKQKELENGCKFQIITELIQNKCYSELGISKYTLQILIRKASMRFQNNRRLKKSNIYLDESVIDTLEQLFLLNGTLNISDLPSNISLDNAKYICNNYEKIKLDLVDKITTNNLKFDKEKLDLNYHNFVAISKNKNFIIIAKLILSLEEDRLKTIINNGEIISELKQLIPFVDLFDELNLNTFSNILLTYPKVKQRILATNQSYSLTSKFRDIVTLANAYSSIDDIHLFALTPKVVNVLGEEKSRTYLEFYLEMLKKKVCYIPPIYIKDNGLIFYSGNYSDQDKLLIGKRYNDSCIDLDNMAGAATFKECLNGKYGDVILVKTKDKKDFAGRILLIRRGNVVQLMVKLEEKFSLDVYRKIANEIIKQSQLVDDNIEYVVINHNVIPNFENEILLDNGEFLSRFPHADLSSRVVLLASCHKELNVECINQGLNFDVEPKYQYSKFRRKISYNPTEDEISRIKALNILLQNDPILREDMARNFEPFYIEDYDKVVCSEDWYIARKITGEIEAVILPDVTGIVKKEFEEMSNMGLTNDLKFNIARR